MAPAIYLDVDDEITTAVSRIRGMEGDPVLLVVPWGSRLASSRINFRLLAREAATQGRDLVIIAAEPAARSLAGSAGLPTFATVMEFESTAGGADVAGPVASPAAPQPQAPASPAVPGGGTDWPPAGGPPASVRSGRPARGGDDGATAAPGAIGAGSALAGPGSSAEIAAGSGSSAAGLPSSDIPAFGRGAGGSLRGPAGTPSLPVVGPARRFGPSRARVAVVLALIGVVALGGAASAAIFLPSAEITLQPATEPIGPVALTVIADPAATSPDPARLVVPAKSLEVPVSVKAQFTATGKELIEQKATGAVTFQNCDTGGAHTFPAGSTVRTPEGVAFVTAASVRLDRAKLNPAFACTAANVNVTAVKAGPEGNVVAGAISRLPSGFDSVVLSVVNRAATSGGSRQELVRVLQADVDAALAALRTQLGEAFAARLADAALPPSGTVLVGGTQRLGDATPAPDPATLVGRQQAGFELGLGATGTVLAVDPGPVTALAEARAQGAVAAGFRLVPGSMRTTVDPPAASGATVSFAVRVRAEQVREINASALLEQIRGRSIAAARTILEPFGSVRITVWPDWVTAIPTMEGRVRLVVAPASTPGTSPVPTAGPAAPPTSTPLPPAAATGAPASPPRTSAPTPTRRP